MDSNDRGIITLLAKGLRDLRAQVVNLARQPGPAGKDGRDGKDGLDGKDGIGLRGIAGSDGADGARGQDGPQGVPGVDGERGPVGPMPKHEWRGTQLRFQQTSGKWGKWVDLQGKPGKAGSGGSVYVNSTPGGGSDGRGVEVQKSATHIQRRYAGDAVWVDLVALTDITGPAGGDGADGNAADIAGETHAATSKATPVDADELGLTDSAASWGLKKLTFADLKAVLLAYFKGQFREKLTAARTYYVRTDGSDSNTGLANTGGGAFLTIQKAIDTVAALDLSTFSVTIQVADGTYAGANTLKPYVTGGGGVTIFGNSASPANVLISVSGNTAFFGNGCGSWTLNGMKLQATTGRGLFVFGKTSQVDLLNINFGACTFEHILSNLGATVRLNGAIAISGNATSFANASAGSYIGGAAITVTLTGTPAFSAFAACDMNAVIVMQSITFSGAATGQRYKASTNGVIQTYGAGVTYLPGSSLGSDVSGGRYA